LVNEAGEKVTNKAEIGNLINRPTYFSEVGEKLATDNEDSVISCNFTSTSLIRQQSASFYLKPITATEVLSHIKQLNPAKSNGSEGIPLKFLKMVGDVIAPILTNKYNNCIKVGNYPKILKIAQIIPIHKSGAKDQCSNFRPISLLSPFSKVFEKCLHERLYSYFKKFDLQNSSLALNKTVVHLMQLGCYIINFVKTLTK